MFLTIGPFADECQTESRSRLFVVASIFSLLAFILCCSTSHADEAVEIRLSAMWGLGIDGTREAGKLFLTKPVLQIYNDSNDELVNWAIEQWVAEQPNEAIHRNLSKRKQMRHGFVVGGIDKAALLVAKVILCDGIEPKDSFSPKIEQTLVFFGSFQKFDLKPVNIEGNRITVDEHLSHRCKRRRFLALR